MISACRYLRTARHLRWQQVVLRLLYPLRTPTLPNRPPPPRRDRSGPWCDPAQRPPSLLGPDTLTLLGEVRRLDEVGWDPPEVPLLWRYNLHYFDDLNAAGALTRRSWHQALVARWIDDHREARGTAWAPYPTSLRIVNWIKWLLSGAPADAALLTSLAQQVRWLSQRIEWHVLGNHLFVNAKALLLGGRFFAGAEADAWTARAVAIFARELPEQILSDGGQFERSPMYHALALEDVLDILNATRAFGPAPIELASLVQRLTALAPPMHRWLRTLTHPDGTLARFNDTADGIAPSVDELTRYARGLSVADDRNFGPGLVSLMPSGYLRAQWDDAVALLDVAPVAPDYLMAHGHADTLSFELSLRGRRTIVNSGTSCYGTSATRLRERGTAAHSTVVVDGQDSSEVWSSFRVGRRARVLDLQLRDGEVLANHNGYAHLPGAPRHSRHWSWQLGGLTVEDTVMPEPRSAVARFHLAPGLRLVNADSLWRVFDGERCVLQARVLVGRAQRGVSTFSPAFGVVLPTESLDVELERGRAVTAWTWS
ncbi:MAG: alginate lyase family protein [Deltaproteobacteria bacterium]|nr:alginate lyase family protein [Deltaproteobacteria bacterium]